MSDDKKFIPAFELSLERAYEVTGTSTPTELVKVLGLSRQAFYQAKSKGVMPKTWANKLQEGFGANPEWVLEGKGERRMAEHHHNLGSALHIMRSGLIKMAIDWGPRYGVNSKPVRITQRILALVDELRSEMDRRAYDECPDIPKDDRLDLYYQGQTAPKFDPTSAAATPAEPTSRLAREVRELRTELEAAGFDQEEIKAGIRRLLTQRTGQAPYGASSAREPGAQAVHENEIDYPMQLLSANDSAQDDEDTLTQK